MRDWVTMGEQSVGIVHAAIAALILYAHQHVAGSRASGLMFYAVGIKLALYKDRQIKL